MCGAGMSCISSTAATWEMGFSVPLLAFFRHKVCELLFYTACFRKYSSLMADGSLKESTTVFHERRHSLDHTRTGMQVRAAPPMLILSETGCVSNDYLNA